ncbi:ATP synthase delta subunit-domain-containing protein [Gaertneriomyces semiglobifer]|nr:ATP synthase delta subunit-domain-containing protein [Gaertneriomyces semiglobifer]
MHAMFALRRSVAVASRAAVRSYATAPAASQNVTAPLSLHGIDGRYATALYTAAAKNGSLDAVESELNRVKDLFNKNEDMKTTLESPLVDKQTKKDALKSLLSGKYSDVTKNLFDAMAENGRLDHTTKVLTAFEELMAAHRKEVPVTVISTKALDAKTTKQLQSILEKSKLVAKGSKLILNNKVDPNILGGLVVDFGDKTIDLSVQSKINKLNRLLTEAI